MHRTTPSPENGWGAEPPYLAARQEWNERYGDYIARARNWRRAAFAALAVCTPGTTLLLGGASPLEIHVTETPS
jgi:type IV secretory pathway TrbF-like protein